MTTRGERWRMQVRVDGYPAGFVRGFGSRTYFKGCADSTVAALQAATHDAPEGDAQSGREYWRTVRKRLSGCVTLGEFERTYDSQW